MSTAPDKNQTISELETNIPMSRKADTVDVLVNGLRERYSYWRLPAGSDSITLPSTGAVTPVGTACGAIAKILCDDTVTCFYEEDKLRSDATLSNVIMLDTEYSGVPDKGPDKVGLFYAADAERLTPGSPLDAKMSIACTKALSRMGIPSFVATAWVDEQGTELDYFNNPLLSRVVPPTVTIKYYPRREFICTGASYDMVFDTSNKASVALTYSWESYEGDASTPNASGTSSSFEALVSTALAYVNDKGSTPQTMSWTGYVYDLRRMLNEFAFDPYNSLEIEGSVTAGCPDTYERAEGWNPPYVWDSSLFARRPVVIDSVEIKAADTPIYLTHRWTVTTNEYDGTFSSTPIDVNFTKIEPGQAITLSDFPEPPELSASADVKSSACTIYHMVQNELGELVSDKSVETTIEESGFVQKRAWSWDGITLEGGYALIGDYGLPAAALIPDISSTFEYCIPDAYTE